MDEKQRQLGDTFPNTKRLQRGQPEKVTETKYKKAYYDKSKLRPDLAYKKKIEVKQHVNIDKLNNYTLR